MTKIKTKVVMGDDAPWNTYIDHEFSNTGICDFKIG